ncbi:type II toxin-antitoxin system VapC family toxin [candidate division WWE3 bacterium]|uniref:Type II toxin-antitoxin system VapC family toxin n=1 Tax=candidate division WWE3 bacterium TaxID=2053526 RepID=A0A955J3R5_UNCKA|nr:type II toxin-antitoxin system VapC family toxin [candidate division WWE3 bacterium]
MAENKSFVVVDCSAIINYLFPDENINKSLQESFNSFLENKIDFVAPSLLKIEVGNTLRTAILRQRLSKEDSQQIFKTFLNWDIKYKTPDNLEVFILAITYNISVYDAQYLYLAINEHYPLLTLDKNLLRAYTTYLKTHR